jgi:hypothetical protein
MRAPGLLGLPELELPEFLGLPESRRYLPYKAL